MIFWKNFFLSWETLSLRSENYSDSGYVSKLISTLRTDIVILVFHSAHNIITQEELYTNVKGERAFVGNFFVFYYVGLNESHLTSKKLNSK